MKEALNKLIRDQLKTYSEQPARMISDYNRERQLMGEYNGRQILEMLQNADDEGSDAVKICLDEDSHTLTIANRGMPFSIAGFESLMLANLSSKTKVQYIGNKGLGFRSIISWAHQIIIKSGSISVVFSEEIARETFEKLFDVRRQREIRELRNLSADAVPVAFLAVPVVNDLRSVTCMTEIVVHYRPEFLAGIKEQLCQVKSECLLFLRHLKTIEIEQANGRRVLRREDVNGVVTIDGVDWTIYVDEARLPDQNQSADKAEDEWYSLKLAVADGLLGGANVLYTFFPTLVSIDFPMVVHGTFDLDSSRNQLIQSGRNKFLLTRLVALIVRTAGGLRDREADPWIQVRLLNFGDRNPVLAKLDFYRQIDDAVARLEIFPCVDGSFRQASEVYCLGDGFSRFVVDAGCGADFPGLVYPGDESNTHLKKYAPFEKTSGFVNAINRLSARLLKQGLERRVELINLLCDNGLLEGQYSVLVNDRGELIDCDTDAYTPRTLGNVAQEMPSYANIDFVSQRLFDLLVARFSAKSAEKARDVQRKLKSITNIHSYEPAQLIRTIIRAASAELRRANSKPYEIIRSMVEALLVNFSAGDSAALPTDVSVPLLNTHLQAVDARELFLSGLYPTGAITERLFAGVYRTDQYLAPPSAYGSVDPSLLEHLFLWLGVNRFVRYQLVNAQQSLNSYESYLFSVVPRPVLFRDMRVSVLGLSDTDLDKILNTLSNEALVEWLIRDPDAHCRLGLANPDKIFYSNANEIRGTHTHELVHKPSYLRFQFRRAAVFDHYVLHRDLVIVNLVNSFTFDFSAPGLKSAGVTQRDIEAVLAHLGAKEYFEDLPIEAVAEILRRLPQTDPKGVWSQRLYRLVRGHFAENDEPLPADVPLFAYCGQQGGYFPQDKIYYSDNIRLPRKIVSRYPVLNYPLRGGGALVSKLFGVSNLNDLDIKVSSHHPLARLSEEMASALRAKRSFLLAYRISKLNTGQQAEAARLGKLAIVLCSELSCEVDGESVQLAINDYVLEGARYFIKVDSRASMDDLARDPYFCDTFADIMSAVFTVGEHWAEFRGVFKDALSEVRHLAYSALGEDLVREAQQLLGMADPATGFWAALWQVRGGDGLESFLPSDMTAMVSELAQYGINVEGFDFERLSDSDNVAKLADVLRALKVSPATFNQVALYKLDFSELHRKRLQDRMHQMFNDFVFALWRRLDGEYWNQREHFLELVAALEDTSWVGSVAGSHSEDMEFDYNAIILTRLPAVFSDLELSGPGDIDQFYGLQASEFTSDQLASLPATARSCLYFQGGAERLREEFSRHAVVRADKSVLDLAARPQMLVGLVVDGSVPVAAAMPVPAFASAAVATRFNPEQDARNRASGLQAEEIVIERLVSLYGVANVVHVAQRRDGAGYDIRYSLDEGASWRYVEVKRYSRDRIYLTNNELAFAIANSECYELFLVNAEDEVFRLVDVDFTDRDRFGVAPTEYVVCFKLELRSSQSDIVIAASTS
jgi:hypothetical protein